MDPEREQRPQTPETDEPLSTYEEGERRRLREPNEPLVREDEDMAREVSEEDR